MVRHLLLWCLLAVTVGAVWLDRRVATRFEALTWDTPATIRYAPLELAVGAPVSKGFLEDYLVRLGYRHAARPDTPGTFSVGSSRLVVHPRPSATPGSDITNGPFSAAFIAGRIVELHRLPQGQALERAVLEPQNLGAVFPPHDEIRYPIALENLPPPLVQALLVTEDRRFFRHFGVDLLGIARAAITNLNAGEPVAGGSTLTQQLVKAMYLTPERSWVRKARELAITLLLEARYSKDAILEAYVNAVYLGQSGRYAIHGFETAARHYFGRPLDELEVADYALLVALLKGASFYNPWRHPERATARRNLVLEAMADAGLLSGPDTERHQRRPLALRDSPLVPEHADLKRLVMSGLRGRLSNRDLRGSGLFIETTIDPWRQHHAERALARVAKQAGATGGVGEVQGAIVVVDYRTGALRAAVAGTNGVRHAFNRTTMARRQIGSLIKPLLYQAYFENFPTTHPFSLVEDESVTLTAPGGRTWAPRNYDRREHGRVTVSEALARSYNLAAVNTGLEVGLREVGRFIRRAGVERPIEVYPSLLLGAVELSPVEVASLFQTLANGGYHHKLKVIESLHRLDGSRARLAERGPELRMNPNAAVMTRYLMTRATFDGTARVLAQSDRTWPVAGKTGTSDDIRDSWFVAFDAQYLTVVWVGRDDNRPLPGSSGNLALQVWRSYAAEVGFAPLPLLEEDGLHWFAAAERARDDSCRFEHAFPALDPRVPIGFARCARVSAAF